MGLDVGRVIACSLQGGERGLLVVIPDLDAGHTGNFVKIY